MKKRVLGMFGVLSAFDLLVVGCENGTAAFRRQA
jgi:hypothetical protein